MYESAITGSSVTIVDIVILVFQVLISVIGTLGMFLLKDLRDRIVRLENLVMGRGADDDGLTLRRRRG